jgi:hypothetical protein
MLMAHATEALIEAKAETNEQVVWFAQTPQTTPPVDAGDQPSSSST